MQIIFIIIEPFREENIGAVARAMKTMGIDKLRLVNPQCNHISPKSKAIAHGSTDILEKTTIYDNFEDSIGDMDLIIGTSAKKRNVHEDYHRVEDLPDIILKKGDTINKISIVFGCEESGLTNHQLSLCHLVSTIPMNSKYPSLNLGQAAMVYATYLSKITLNHKRQKQKNLTKAELPIVLGKAKQILDDVEIPEDGNIYPRIIERLMTMNKDDINLFHSFCKFYLKKYHGRIK